MNNQCEIKGEGIDYIQQVSVDGGTSWFPQEATGLIVKPTANGQKTAMIPLLANKKMLQIKLRDFPKTEGLPVQEFIFSNTVKATKKTIESKNPNVPQTQTNQPKVNPVQNQNQKQLPTQSPKMPAKPKS
jgi:hypothetical protein